MMLAMVLLQTPENLKTETAEESFNPDGLAQRSIKLLKDTFPDIEVSLFIGKHLPLQYSFAGHSPLNNIVAAHTHTLHSMLLHP